MDLSVFDGMDEKELRAYVRYMLWHYRLVDAFWFLRVETHFGTEAAERINEEVWSKVAPRAARDLKEAFHIEEKGLKGFLRALEIYPWTPLVGYQIEEKDGAVYIGAPHCPPQEARIRNGMGEFDCKEMHRGEFVRFAREIDPRIQVECLFAPPDDHPPELFCQWRFTVEE